MKQMIFIAMALTVVALSGTAHAQSAPGGLGDARERMLPSTEGLSGTYGDAASTYRNVGTVDRLTTGRSLSISHRRRTAR